MIFGSICFFLASCEKDKNIEINGTVQIENYSIADTILLNEEATAQITAAATNGCWRDLYIDLVNTAPKEYQIKAYGTYSCNECDCVCPAVMVYHDTLITFQPTQRGTYLLRIQKDLHTMVTDTLIVK